MKRKLRILGNISIIALSVCMFAFGVYAANQASVTTSGTVSFNATNVYARVTRTIENIDSSSTYNTIDITYDAGTVDNHEDKFENENLVFESADKEIVMRFTIQNLATEAGRYVYVTFSETESESNNVTKLASALGGELAIAPGETKDVVVYMYVSNPNLSASAGYNYTLALNNKSAGVILDDTLATFTASSDCTYYTLSGLKTTSTAQVSAMSTPVATADTIDPSTLTNIIIPAEYNNKPVKEIGASAFASNTILTNVTLPDSITTIGASAFTDCTSLTVVNINNSSNLTTISSKAFYQTTLLSHINIPSTCTTMQQQAFIRSGLIEINLPEGMTEISAGLLSTTHLFHVVVPSTVETIGQQAFGRCYELKLVILPENIKKIVKNAFFYCYELKECNLPDSITEIGEFVFYECYKLELTKLPKNLTTISQMAFYNCTSLKSLTLPESLVSIGQWAFAECTSLESVTFPSAKLTTIGKQSFENCSKLSSVILPETSNRVTIGNMSFSRTGLTGEFYLPNNYAIAFTEAGNYSNGPFIETKITSFKVSDNNPIYMVQDGVLYKRKSTDSSSSDYNVPYLLDCYPGGRVGSYTLPATVTVIRRYELTSAYYLSAINVETGNTTYSSEDGILYANLEKTWLQCVPRMYHETKLNIRETVTEVRAGAFGGKEEEIYLPQGIKLIDGCAFQYCSNLKKVAKIGQSVQEGTFDFSHFDSLTGIAYKALQHCEGMKTLKVGVNCKSFGDGCFQDAINLEEIYIYNETSVVSVVYDTYAETAEDNFKNLTKLKAIYVPDALVDSYKSSEYWAPVASKIKPISQVSAS